MTYAIIAVAVISAGTAVYSSQQAKKAATKIRRKKERLATEQKREEASERQTTISRARKRRGAAGEQTGTRPTLLTGSQGTGAGVQGGKTLLGQ